jgi:D-alanine-D-alanine ligase
MSLSETRHAAPGTRPSVLVLGGGPDAEREVSITSARHVADALRAAGHVVHAQTIDTLTIHELRALPGDVVFPVLHGGWGEGGPLQDLLEQDGRPFVGSGSRAARMAMDKVATKAVALSLGIPTPQVFILDPRDPVCPMDFPVVVKPVHEGSTIGLYICNNEGEWAAARATIADELSRGVRRSYMIEPRVPGRELTVGIIDGQALPIIEITPAEGLYDYDAKYHRNDTRYTLDPDLPPGVTETIKTHAVNLARAIGTRHLARVDFILDPTGIAGLLEVNTLPGFTDHSLVPMAAAHAGEPMPALCSRLVSLAVRDAGSR